MAPLHVLHVRHLQVGDGDCGATIKRGGEAVLAALPSLDFSSPTSVCSALAATVARGMGGTSGALYQIFFAAAGASLRNCGAERADAAAYADAARVGVEAIMKHGGAKEGDRSMVDALAPAATAASEAARGVCTPHCRRCVHGI